MRAKQIDVGFWREPKLDEADLRHDNLRQELCFRENVCVAIHEHQVGRTRFEKVEVDAATVASQPAVIQLLRERTDPDLVLDVRLVGVRRDDLDLDVDEIEGALAPSFLKVRVRDASLPALTEGPLPSPDTIAGAFIRDLEARIVELEAVGSTAGAAEQRDALRLGRLLLAGHEVSL